MTQREFEMPEAFSRLIQRHVANYTEIPFHRVTEEELPSGDIKSTIVVANLTEPTRTRSETPAEKEMIEGIGAKVHKIAEWMMTSDKPQPLTTFPDNSNLGSDEDRSQYEEIRREFRPDLPEYDEMVRRVERDRWFGDGLFLVFAYSQQDEQAPQGLEHLVINIDAPNGIGLAIDFDANRTFNLTCFPDDEAVTESPIDPGEIVPVQPYTSSDLPLGDMRDDEAEIINFYLDKFIQSNLVPSVMYQT